jgi:hypothetical protein
MMASALDAAVCYACLAVLFVAAVRSWRLLGTVATRFGVTIAGMAALAFAVRALAPPAFIHSGFHGYSLLDSIVSWPSLSVYKPGYGHATFITLGLACRLLGFIGDGWRETVLANAVFGTGILVAASLLAFRAGGTLAGYAAMAAGILHPLFVRTSSSEDAHVVACFYGMVALVAADAARRAGAFTVPRLSVLVAAGLLAFYGRQTMFFWPPLLVLVAGWGRFRDLARRRSSWVVMGIVALAMVPKLMLLAGGLEESYGLILRWTIPLMTPSVMARHPLFLPAESGALLLALSGAVPALVRKSDATLAILAGGAAFAFVSSFAMLAQPGWGLEYGFRLPLFSLLLPIVGVGSARTIEAIRGLGSQRSVVVKTILPASVVIVLCLYPAPALSRVLSQPSPLAQEYRLIAAGATTLPKNPPADVTVFVGSNSELKVPHSAFGSDVRVLESSGNEAARGHYAYQSLGCFCYPLKELVDPSGPDFNGRISAMTSSDFRSFVRALWDDPLDAIHRMGGAPPTQELRPECQAAFRGALRFIPWGEVEVGRQEPLDRYLTRERVPIGVWELPANDPQTLRAP